MQFTLKNPTGLHARPAGLIVSETKKYKSEIHFIKDGESFNAKSIMSLMSMEAQFGDSFDIICKGEDQEEALQGILLALESL